MPQDGLVCGHLLCVWRCCVQVKGPPRAVRVDHHDCVHLDRLHRGLGIAALGRRAIDLDRKELPTGPAWLDRFGLHDLRGAGEQGWLGFLRRLQIGPADADQQPAVYGRCPGPFGFQAQPACRKLARQPGVGELDPIVCRCAGAGRRRLVTRHDDHLAGLLGGKHYPLAVAVIDVDLIAHGQADHITGREHLGV